MDGEGWPVRAAMWGMLVAALGHLGWAVALAVNGWIVDFVSHLLMVCGLLLAAYGVTRLPAGEGTGMVAAGLGIGAYVRSQDIVLGLAFPGYWMAAAGVCALGFAMTAGRAALSGRDPSSRATARGMAWGALVSAAGALMWVRLNLSGAGLQFLPGSLLSGAGFLLAAVALAGGFSRLVPRRAKPTPPAA